MNTTLRQLVNNPNGIGLEELRAMMSGDDALCAEVKKVVGCDVADNVLRQKRLILPEGKHSISKSNGKEYSTGYTKVFVWGDRESGKTSVIGSLLACGNTEQDETITVDEGDERGVMLQRCFSDKSDFALMPNEMNRTERKVNVHNVVLRQRSTPVTHRSYPITLVEVPLTLGVKGGSIAKDILDTEGEQIHLLCLDCTGDIAYQGRMFNRLLEYLDEFNYIRDKTSGVFIVVTKTDMMYRVPREYRDMAGQTMVTAKLKGLWQKVCNICYDKGIYGATPIAYTVGDVKLQCIVKYNLRTAETLWHDVILPKSQPMVSGLERVLRWGNGSLTAAVFIALIGLAGYELYGVLKPDATPPTAVNQPYDYSAEFIKKVNMDIEGMSYAASKKHYATMREDLEEEHKIKTIDGELVLSDKEYDACNEALSNAFAESVNKAIDDEMEKSVWDDKLLQELLSSGKNLLNHNLSHSQSNETEEKTALVKKYFDEIKPMVSRIANCQSLSDVEYAMDHADECKEAPFTNNKAVADALTNAKTNSIKSYTEYLKQQAQNIESGNSDKDSYQQAMENLNSSIDEFSRYLNSNGYQEFVSDLRDMKQKLRETYNSLFSSFFGNW